jgi:hypothetical protein
VGTIRSILWRLEPADLRAPFVLFLLAAGQLLAAPPAAACDLDALRGSFRLAVYGRAGEVVDYVGQPPDEMEAQWRLGDPQPISLLGLAEQAFLLRREHLAADGERRGEQVEQRVVVCAGDHWEIVPWLLAGKRATKLDAGGDELTAADGHLVRSHAGAPRTYISWDGAALREARWPLRSLARVEGLYVFWSCKQDAKLAVGMSVRVVRAGKDVVKGTLTGAFQGACEAELDVRTYDGSVRAGDLLEVLD